ncbi:MAG: methyltransferase domain-containing protein [Phycisphaerales bacterium]|nr:methyltransferase domain-containing protein [Phycisphaerales bacterium]
MRVLSAAIGLLAVVCGRSCTATRPVSVKPGINDPYKAADLKVDEWVARFEAESREVYAERAAIVDALDIHPGQTVADVGCGTGLFEPMLAHRVTAAGRVIAIDIVPDFVSYVRKQVAKRSLRQVSAQLCSETSVELPANSVDAVFVADTYHHFEYPEETLASIREALRTGGALYILDFERIEGVSRDWVLGHVRAGKADVRAEIERAGFRFDGELTPAALKENYLIRFTRN